MKKFFKIIVFSIVVLFVILLILPFAFQDKLSQIAKEEINNQLDAKADFSELSLSFISSFPNAEISLHDLSVIGVDAFNGDTLSYIEKISVKVGMMDVFKQPIEINSIILENVTVSALILENGTANWDIAKETEASESAEELSTEESSSVGLRLKEFRINDANILYQDKQGNMDAEINGLNFLLSGDLSADKSTIKTNTTIDELSYSMDGLKYLNQANVNWKADLETDLINSKYTFNNNLLLINALEMGFDGWLAMPHDDIEMDLKFQSKQNSFKQILSLIPVIYMNDFEEVQTSGKLSFNGMISGLYNENTLPSFDINLMAENGRFQYPDMPSSVENIQMDLNIANSDGIEDHTRIHLKNFHMEMENNPFDMKMKIATPVSDPSINGEMIGKIDLNNFQDLIPDETMKIGGIIDANLQMKGKMSAIENEKYDEFQAKGNFNLTDFRYEDHDYPQGIQISRARAVLSPQYISLKELIGATGSSDFSIKGQLNHILDWYFNTGLLKGVFEFSSDQIVLSDFMSADSEEEPEERSTEPQEEMSVIEIPENIDLLLISQIDKLIYDSIEIDQIKGKITLKDSKAALKNVSMNLLNGKMTMSGSYSAKNIEKPKIDFDINAQDINIKKSFDAFNTIQKLAPIAKYAQGDVSAQMQLDALLKPNMDVDLNTLNSSGSLTSDNISIKNSPLLGQLTNLIKSDKFENLALQNMDLSYEMKNGQLEVKPFDTKVGKSIMTIGGSQSIDQSIEYSMDFAIPSSEFGSNANNVANQLFGEANKFGLDLKAPETIKFKTYVRGTLSNPKLSLSSKDQSANMKDELTKQAKERLKEETDKAKQKAVEEAQKQADRLLSEADNQGKEILAEAEKIAEQVRQEAYKQADAAKAEAHKQADNLIKEAGSDMVKKMLAKNAAEKLKKEANNSAQKLKNEADNQKQKKIQLAKDKAQKLKTTAKKEGDALIDKAKSK